ncbi:MAG TPA: serine protease [Pirellulales bacterium]|jgi:hypothetical protein
MIVKRPALLIFLLWSAATAAILLGTAPLRADESPITDVEQWRLASLWPGSQTPQAPQTPLPAVVRVIAVDRDSMSLGSGTLVDASEDYGLVITNWHVVRDAVGPVEVVFPCGFHSMARVVRTDREWDLAALLIWKPPAVSPVPVSTVAPRPGDMLTIAGYGKGDYKMQSGPCTEYLAPAPGRPAEIVELAAAARHGDSGGPILNTRGELAGVLFGEGGGHTDGSYGGRVHKFLELTALDLRTLPASNSNYHVAATTNAANGTSPNTVGGTASSTARFEGGIANAQVPHTKADWNAWEANRLAARPNTRNESTLSNNLAERPLALATDAESKPSDLPIATLAKGSRFVWHDELKSFLAAFGVAAMLLHMMRLVAG